MPELAEVEYYRKQWMPAKGEIVASVLLHEEKRIFRGVDTASLKRNLVGQALLSSATHGKQMCFRFGEKNWLCVHLGMTGKTLIADRNQAPLKHDHLMIQMEKGAKLVFTDPRMFGRVQYAKTATAPEWWSGLPPQILSDAFTQDYFNTFLERRAKSSIKAVLLMQETFPGLGNWMVDEILWRSQIHPATQPGKISKQKRIELYNRVLEVCQDAMKVIGTDWGTPPDDWLFNHRWKDGGHCPQTGVALKREQIGGRTTCWSPKWQTYHGIK
ncbi:Fpg/Nei family DNA glycosylase [bacterium]|nr:Fpg/Nei family DNA glycosylase [bacterium]